MDKIVKTFDPTLFKQNVRAVNQIILKVEIESIVLKI